MRTIRHTIEAAVATVVLVILLAAAGGSPALAASYPTGSDANQPANWEGVFEHPAQCYKHEAGDNSAHGRYFGGGYLLSTFDQSWPGDHWEALIIKSGQVNDVFIHPNGNALYDSVSGKDISHVIVCKGTTPEVTPSPTSTPSPSVSPTPEPTTTPSPSETPSPTTTPSPSPSPTASPTPTASPSPSPSASPTTPSASQTPTPTLPPTDMASEEPSEETDFGGLLGAIGAVTLIFLIAESLNTWGNSRARRRW